MTDSELLSMSCYLALMAYRQAITDLAIRAGVDAAAQEVEELLNRHATDLQWAGNAEAIAAVDLEALLSTAAGLTASTAGKIATPSLTTRQATLFEQLSLSSEYPAFNSLNYRYPLKALSVNSLFPQPVTECEPVNEREARAEYHRLWTAFCEDLDKIPQAQRQSLPLWLDHLDSLWQAYAHAIPATEADSDVSLYDQTRTTAALAVALWRFHYETDGGFNADLLTIEGNETHDKFLLIQGDFFGIQDFIFASGGETRKRAAKLLRGRSFYVSLLMECAAFHILDTLGLPVSAQVSNAAGKLLIVAPNIPATREKIPVLQQELDEWFLDHTLGQSGIGLAGLAANSTDFAQDNFPGLIKRLFARLEQVKLRRFDLCRATSALSMPDYLDCFEKDASGQEKGACAVDGRSPATVKLEDKWISRLADDQIAVGSALTRCERLVLSRTPFSDNPKGLRLDIFGFHVRFIDQNTHSKTVDPEHRLLDFALPRTPEGTLWNGLARRAINAWVPVATQQDKTEEEAGKYIGVDEELNVNAAKTLNHLACDNRYLNKNGDWKGIAALMTLKGDVDDLGSLFQRGLAKPGFAKMAALSRQMNAFFSIWLPFRCKTLPEAAGDTRRPDYRNIYTVFAGGDDFFLIGPWHSSVLLAREMREKFMAYVAGNPRVHFSAGLAMSKPSLPINYLAHHAEAALEAAKDHDPDSDDSLPDNSESTDNPGKRRMKPKNAVCCFNHPVSWDDFNKLLSNADGLDELRTAFGLSSGYFYDLLHLVSLRESINKHPEHTIWHSKFQYRTWRLLESSRTKEGKKLSYDERKRKLNELAESIAAGGINQHQGNYRIALFTHLYQHRS